MDCSLNISCKAVYSALDHYKINLLGAMKKSFCLQFSCSLAGLMSSSITLLKSWNAALVFAYKFMLRK